jgi:hypothetical protein
VPVGDSRLAPRDHPGTTVGGADVHALNIGPAAEPSRQVRVSIAQLEGRARGPLVHHPDRHAEPAAKARAEERFKAAAEAYRVLSSPEGRRAYDARLRSSVGQLSRGEAIHHPRDWF